MSGPQLPGPSSPDPVSRRRFMQASAVIAGAAAIGTLPAFGAAPARRASRLRIGVIGCGGRGTGAAQNALEASPDTEIVAIGDVLKERVDSCRSSLTKLEGNLSERVRLSDATCFTGWDAYRQVIDAGVDSVILATPPGFRPAHYAYAIEKRKHVFMEKPVAVDPVGVRKVIEASRAAEAHGLCVVAGTQRRHQACYLAAIERIRRGDIGEVRSAQCYWMQGGLWMHTRRPEWSDAEWQLRNWLYFTWLSGDHIVEQHVHNIDVVNWVLGNPVRVQSAMGGRQVRTDAAYGHVFDHFAIVFEYPNGAIVTSMCQQIDGCQSRVEECFQGTRGTAVTAPGRAQLTGDNAWRWTGDEPNPYMVEHKHLYEAIASGTPLNEGVRIAESTLTAIMARMSAYTGKPITWEQAMSSELDLTPPNLQWGDLATPPIPVPGKTKFV
ncbi:MAG: Gfo/Idh/MocA family oxidoreductase [Planctomycetota bacterium]|nr:Gfo/Idh/MocA family oxidoreductase [Planctomycetota bacterium]